MSWTFFDHSDFKIKTCFSQELLGHLKPHFTRKPMGKCE